jgi:hypothetical protein
VELVLQEVIAKRSTPAHSLLAVQMFFPVSPMVGLGYENLIRARRANYIVCKVSP